MPRRTTQRLSRSVILDRALEIAEKTDTQPGQALTGKSLGDALGVDRSAIWRHFDDKDDLLLSTADRIIGIILDSLPATESPKERLETLFRSFILTFGRYPFVGSELGYRNFTQVNGNTAWELIVSGLLELGVPRAEVVSDYRVFADIMIALAAAHAQGLQRTDEEHRRDTASARAALFLLEPTDFPNIVSDIDAHVSITGEKVAERFLAIYWNGIAARATT